MVTAGTDTVFHAPGCGVNVVLVSSKEGCPPESLYNPRAIWPAVDVESTYSASEPIEPLLLAVAWNACARPSGLVSRVDCMFGLPSRTEADTTVNASGADVFPFDGIIMATEYWPALTISVLYMVATACVELTMVVGRIDPFHSATHLLQKFFPVSVSEKVAPPATALLGVSVFRTGGLVPQEVGVEVVCPNTGRKVTKTRGI